MKVVQRQGEVSNDPITITRKDEMLFIFQNGFGLLTNGTIN